MSVINILSPHLADMIAAGEVVERPASVIKELTENSFDAGAKKVTVEIRGGGSTYIRVTDDGCGMSPEDAGIAFLRHATSKLHDEHGLESIATMGFRGEALAAVSAVSDIELKTRRRDAEEGISVLLTAGDIQDMKPVGCPFGTDIIIRNLFFNTPARQKFLKSDRSEASACQLAALRCALSRPDVSVKFVRDGEVQFISPGDGDLASCAYSVIGRDTALGMLRCDGSDNGLAVSGLVSSPSACRGNRSAQFFFCNGRFIKSTLLQSALEQAYRNSLLSGRYPGCILYLTIPYGSVDVNVHPAKTEVKFSDEKKIFDLVYYSVLSALTGEHRAPVTASGPAEKKPSPAAVAAPAKADPVAKRKSDAAAGAELLRIFAPQEDYRQTSLDLTPSRPAAQEPSAAKAAAPAVPVPVPEAPKVSSSERPAPAAEPVYNNTNVEKPVQNVDNLPVPDHKISGEVFKKYIIVEVGDDVVLIDKHAAHERLLFDTLKARGLSNMSQALLVPVPLRLDPADCEILSENGELLCELGFEIEPLDAGNFVVRGVPADMYAEDLAPAIEEICEKLRSGNAPDPASVRDEVLHTVACKAAIKAGWDTSLPELEKLVCAVLSGRVLYCPHGRPVSYRISGRDLDRRFKRII